MNKKQYQDAGQYRAPYPPYDQPGNQSGAAGWNAAGQGDPAGYPGANGAAGWRAGSTAGYPGANGEAGRTPPPPPGGTQRRPMLGKSSFWTFCFAFVPGAGQMYLGYMQRGLSLILLFCVTGFVADLFYDAVVFMPVIWMYSFFDTFNLRAQLMAGQTPPDEMLFSLGQEGWLRRLMSRRQTVLGWVLVVLGLWALVQNFVLPPLRQLSDIYPMVDWLCSFLRDLPSLALVLALIGVGVWLVRGPRQEPGPEEDIHYYAPGGAQAAPDAAPKGPSRDLFGDADDTQEGE